MNKPRRPREGKPATDAIARKGSRRPREASPSKQQMGDAAPAPAKAAPRALFTVRIPVRWRDLDAFNHVNNSSFFTYLEEARLQWLKNVPGPWFDAHSMPVLAAAELNYRAPIAWPAQVTVEMHCERVGSSSITIGHRIVDANEPHGLYCDGRTVLVWTDPATGKSVALPEAIRSACS